ncbi:MAG: aminopeptidase P N-terminal domain-containing protein [Chloroflexota bacterium]
MEPSFYIENRRRLAANLADGELMLFFSGEGVRKSADENYPFFANRNFLYLTGVKQERCALLLYNQGGQVSQRLLALKPDPAQEIWTGRRLTPAELAALSGIEQVDDIERLEQALGALLAAQPSAALWLCLDALAPQGGADLEREFARTVQARHPQVQIKNSYPLVCAQRKIKAPGEIAAMRQAMQITAAGIRRMMQLGGPGRMEYELEAAFNAELAAHGQRRTAFGSIISSGERNFYLHYAELQGRIEAGELVLTDVGAAYDEYCTDISRVFPANGRFSERQAQLYRVAYAANRAVMAQVRPGAPFSMPNQVCRQTAFEGLRALGLLDDPAEIGRYVWHGVTHHVGLDTHDVGGYQEPMAENMVFTVDAGIYVREWGIGLRIEDNVLVTRDGCENLSAAIPAEIEAIEALMAG